MSEWTEAPPRVDGQALPSRHRTPVEELDDRDSHAVAAWCTAIDEEAEAENEYLRLYQIAYVESVEIGVAQTVRGKWCENQDDVCVARRVWNLAVAAEKRCRAKVGEVERRSMRAMSHQRFIRDATGG